MNRPTFPGPLAAWWSWRRRRAWLLWLALGYSLVGFLAVPWLIERQLTAHSETWLGLPASVDAVYFNPWRLRLEVAGFALHEPGGDPVLGAAGLVVNVQISSLFRLAVTLRELAVDAPFAKLVRHSDGSLNIDPLLRALSGDPGDPPPDPDDGPIRLLIQELVIAAGVVDVTDEAHNRDFSAAVGPIDITVHDLTTLPDKAGDQSVSVRTRQGTELEINGTFELAPFVANGHIVGRGPYLPILYQYFQDQIDFELSEGDVELEFDYAVEVTAQGLEASLRNLDGVLRGMSLTPEGVDDPEQRIARLPEVRVTGGELDWPGRRVAIESVQVVEPQVSIRRDAAGAVNVLEMIPPPAGPVGDDTPGTADLPWSIGVAEFRVITAHIDVTDQIASLPDPAALEVSSLDIDVTGFSTEPGARFVTRVAATLGRGGQLSVAGPIAINPELSFSGEVQVDALALPVFQPWLHQVARVTLRSGTVAINGTVNLEEGQLSFAGDGAVDTLGIDDDVRQEPIVGWQRLGLDQVAFSTRERNLDISVVTLDAPYARVHIDADGSTNIDAVLRDDEPADDDVDAQAPFAITVGALTVAAGSADFSDLSLPLPFAARIDALEGSLSTLSSVSQQPAQLELAGTVGEFGLLEVEGQLGALQPAATTDLTIGFKNVDVPTLSPYVIKFAGRGIDDGRMDLKLRYQLSGDQLQGDNNIAIRQLQLGEKVHHPGAQDLPLDLAVALLTDSNGVINLDIPVSGDIGDPQFSIGGIVAGAFGNLIGGIVTSPFRLLGSLVGAGGGDFDSVEFRAGSAELAPPALEKLDQLASALAQRPALQLVVRGVWNADLDVPALQTARLADSVEVQLTTTDESAPLVERRQRALEALARDQLDADLGGLRDAHQVPGPLGGARLDVPAYLAVLEQLLADAQEITPADLTALATARARAVEEAVLATVELSGRVELTDSAKGPANDDGWVAMRLELEH